MSAVRTFGAFVCIVDDDTPGVALVRIPADDLVIVTPDNLPDLRRALDWLESEWATPGTAQGTLPLG